MNHASLFSGIGGFDLAAREVGWNNVFQCEIDPFCQSVLKYYFPKTVLYEDIKRTDFTSWKGKIDVLTGGFPCQPFSVAGQRKGADDNRYLWPEMLRVIRETRPLNPSISITGGEPTKSRRLVPILRIIEKYGYRKRTLTTNGSGLFDIVENKPILQHIADNHFQHLNISKAHFDEDTNKRIMQYENGYCSNDDIYRIAIFAKANNLRPRMSCLLLKEGINDMDGIIRYLDYYNSLCIDNVIFRETMDYDERAMRNHDKMAYLKENKVYLNDIWKCIDKDNRFTPIKQLLGYYYYVEVYKYQNIDMVSESANLVKLYEQKQIANDVVFEMIFHPNGNLNGSWVDDEDILLAYNPYKS